MATVQAFPRGQHRRGALPPCQLRSLSSRSAQRPVPDACLWLRRRAPHADRLTLGAVVMSQSRVCARAHTSGGVPPLSTRAPPQPPDHDRWAHWRSVRSPRAIEEDIDGRPVIRNSVPGGAFGKWGRGGTQGGALVRLGAPHPWARPRIKGGGAPGRRPPSGRPTRERRSKSPQRASPQPAGTSFPPPPGFRKTACTQQRRIVSPSLRLTCSTRAVRSSSTSNPTDVKRAASSSCVKK